MVADVDVVKVGKHELELLIDKSASGVRLEAPGYRTPSAADSGGGWETGFDCHRWAGCSLLPASQMKLYPHQVP